MKLNQSGPQRASNPPQKSSLYGQMPAWAITGKANQLAALKRQQATSSLNRPPELWLRDGETKRIRFRDDEPIAVIYRYSVQQGSNWVKFTKPADGTPDLFQKHLGLRPSFSAIFEVIDVDGYENKEGKKLRNIPRFLAANSRLFAQLQQMVKLRGPLTNYDVLLSRSGTGTSTVYSAMNDVDAPQSLAARKAERLRPKFAAYYAPPTLAQQKAMVGEVVEEEDVDDSNRPF